MREGLRSGSLRKRVDKVSKIPDLNIKEDLDELSKIDGECNDGMYEGKFHGVGEDNVDVNVNVNAMEVEDDCGKCGSQKVDDTNDENEIDGCCGILGCGSDVGEKGKNLGVEGLTCAVDSCNEVRKLGSESRSFGDDRQKMVDVGENEQVKEDNLESADDDECGVTEGAGFVDVEGDHKDENKGDHVHCGVDAVDVLVESTEKMGSIDGSECKFDDDGRGRVQVVGKVLRSRVVPASRRGKDSGGTGRKRKRDTDGREEDAAFVKGENDDSERICKDESPMKCIGHSEEEIVPINEAPVVSKVEVEDANHNSVSRPRKKGKRGRPRKYVDCPAQEDVQRSKVEVRFEDEVGNLSCKPVSNLKKKGKRGRPRKLVEHNVEDGIQIDTVEVASEVDGNLTGRRLGRPKKKGKRGRPRKYFSGEVVGKVKEEAGNIGRKSVRKLKQECKRGRPKKLTDVPAEEIVQTKKVPFCDVDGVEDVHNKSGRIPKKKGKRGRGRPRKQEGNGAVNMISFKKGKIFNDRKMKVSLLTAPARKSRMGIRPRRRPGMSDGGVPSKKEIVSHEKVKSCRPNTTGVNTSHKGEEAPMHKSNLSLKRKRVETVGSVSAEKNLIRKRIVDMLKSAGWTVEYRPRQGREYNDAVYVNPEGKTHWSVTKAYNTLKQAVEKGEVGSGAGNTKFHFSPIPEEVLSKLFRVVSKTRSDKNKKKKHKDGIGDTSDEEFTRDKSENAAQGAKHKRSVKRKPSARDGTQSKRRCALLVRSPHQGSNSEGDGITAYSGKHSVLAWMIDSSIIPLDGKVQYMNRHKTKSELEGSVTKDGIHCSCCNQVISVSEFESHAGSKLSEQYANVFLESGHSLLQCQLDAWNKQEEMGRTGYHSVPVDGDDPNDDTCGICGDGGDLVCCDGCPSTFHHDCLNIEEVPSGEWHCVYCSCKICGGVGETASETDDDCDMTASSLVTCCLCNGKYHQSCVDEVDAICGESRQLTFCGQNCKQIIERFQSLVGAKHDLDDGFSWTLLQRFDVEVDDVTSQPQKILCNSKLAVALSVMDECFLPILDPRSGINLIRHIVYSCGSNFNRLNFNNFFTVVLERGDEIISAASVRIHGKGLAEMPFIGTRNIYRRQGMCRRLLSAIELALGSLDVEKLVIPAIPELLHTWTSVFGFKPLEESVKEEMRSVSMLVFPHTDMLQKLALKQQVVKKTIPVIEENVKCGESGNEYLDVRVDKSEVDNGSVNATFDLNCAAPDLPESSTDERHLVSPGSTAGNCEDEVKSGMNFGEITDANKIQGQSSPKENEDDKVGASAQAISTEGRTLQPDLNLTEENVFGECGNPNFSEDEKCHVHHCSASVNLDEVVKSTRDSPDVDGSSLMENGSELNDLPKSECEFDGTNCQGVSTHGETREYVTLTAQGDDNSAEVTCNDVHRFPLDETGHSSSLVGCHESEVGCSNIVTSDACGEEIAELGAIGEVASPKVNFVSECEFHDTKEEFSSDETGAQLSTKSTDSPLEYTSLAPITSDNLCNMSSVAADTCIPGHFRGNSIPKVGSES